MSTVLIQDVSWAPFSRAEMALFMILIIRTQLVLDQKFFFFVFINFDLILSVYHDFQWISDPSLRWEQYVNLSYGGWKYHYSRFLNTNIISLIFIGISSDFNEF